MSPRKIPQSLPEWLDLATRFLVPSAQTRVRAEIETHYAEAVQSHLLQDAPDPAAHAAALADLGDARVAARRFRQKHLTLFDVRLIHRQMLWDRSRLLVGTDFIWLGGFFFILAIHPKSDPLPFWFLMALWLAYSLVGILAAVGNYALAEFPASLANVRRLVLRHLVRLSCSTVILLTALCALGWSVRWDILHGKTDNIDMSVLFWMMLMIYALLYNVANSLNFLRWRKLLVTAGDDWNGSPPRRPTPA